MEYLFTEVKKQMTLQDLKFALELGCVMTKDIDYILEFGKKNGINTEEIDNELVKLGYERVFEEAFDDYYDDDDFGYVEKFPNRSKFYED